MADCGRLATIASSGRPEWRRGDRVATDLAVLGVHALELLDQVEYVRGMLVIEREPLGVLLRGGLREVLLLCLDEAVV